MSEKIIDPHGSKNTYNISELNKQVLELFRAELQEYLNVKVTTDDAVMFILEDFLKSQYNKMTGIKI